MKKIYDYLYFFTTFSILNERFHSSNNCHEIQIFVSLVSKSAEKENGGCQRSL